MEYRIGHGYDVHRFADAEAEGSARGLVLGGVPVPHDRTLLAHSDGDVLIHALCDAILGASGAGDIGQHFPDSDPSYANIDSSLLLSEVVAKAGAAGWRVGNGDLTVVAQAPKLAPFIPAMRERLAALLKVENSCLNIKATTTEGLGFAGRREGIACHAVVLLTRVGAQ
jgi:2-C-methyl-D-erythritol 2,4-cyclodiphosphate synthase